MRRLLCIACALGLAGCPAKSEQKSGAPLQECRAFGQTCQVAPGKLGACVVRDGCTEEGGSCYVCQSQH